MSKLEAAAQEHGASRALTRREWASIFLLVAFIAIAALCLVWFGSTGTNGRSLDDAARLAQQHASCATLSRHLSELFALGLEPAGAEPSRAMRLQRLQEEMGREYTALRGRAMIISDVKQRQRLIDDIRIAESEARLFLEEAAAQPPPPPPPGSPGMEGAPPPRRDLSRRFAALKDRYAAASAALERVRDFSAQIEQQFIAQHRHSDSQTQVIEATLAVGLLSMAAGLALFFQFAAKRARSDVRVKAALVDQLREAEAKYHSIFDNASEGMFQTTVEGRFLMANSALARLYGYRSPEHLISSLTDIGGQLYVEPEQRRALIDTVLADGSVTKYEVEVMRADGRTMWIRENVRVIRNERGEALYLEGSVEDISAHWWGEQRRRLQQATSRVLDKAASVAEARPMILQTICEILGWDMGAIWDVEPEAGVLGSVELWHAPEIEIDEFMDAVSRITFGPGDGLAGEVWESGEPKWISDLNQAALWPSGRLALRHGMITAFGVPVKVDGEVRHIVEFFSPKKTLPDPEMLQTLGLIASQLGHLIERKSAEEALRKSEMRKAAILRAAIDCIISFDDDGRILEFNPASERAFGITQAEALGRDITDLIVSDGVKEKRGLSIYNAAGPQGAGGRRVELSALRNDGREFPVEVTVSKIALDGRPIFTTYLRDITERKAAERLTSELAAVVANSNDAIIGCNTDGIVRSWNSGAERIFGYNAREVIGRSLQMLLPPDRAEEFPQMLAALRRGDSLVNYETTRLRKDGRKISVSLTDSPIRGEGGRVTGLSSIARDMTERKRLEEELLQSQKMDAVGRLAGGIAHDFNNILTAILGYSDLLIGQIDERHWMYKHLSEVRKAADFAASLTHQLLAFSRRQPLYLRVFCINDTIRNLQKMLQRVIGEQIRIETHLNAVDGRLKADPSQLEQVLLNLCVNARDAMPNGGCITITASDISYFPSDETPNMSEMPAGEYVKLTVADTGTGIPDEILRHIFEPFFTTKESGQGTGLGLATCYGIVKQSGGYITVESKVGVGTSFAIYLPRVDESGVKAAARKEVGLLPGGTETILYVEDELTVRSLTSHVLRKLGYTVLEAADGKQARDIVTAQNGKGVDLLFSDVVLPDLGGRELAEWVSQRIPHAKLLFTSGYVDDALLQRHGLTSTAAFLQKPFTPADLAKKVREIIDEAPAS